MQSVVAFVSEPGPFTLELFAMPVLFFVLLLMTLLAGLPWRAGLFATGALMGLWVFGYAAKSGDLSPATAISSAVAAMLLIIFWKLRGRSA